MNIEWITDNESHPGSVPRGELWLTVEHFPAQVNCIDVCGSETWKGRDGLEHRGTVLGRALPFDNGEGLKWEAIVYTDSYSLVHPPTLATGIDRKSTRLNSSHSQI